ncbi:hypothetical protein [Pantanalinema sp. GBBB05]|uniref:hypothetical protein n=1 Tax=Pantanalinema sp. GBBB05 TaxID=2604139 RepID=UPI001D69A805|nr:hypothetical protein [Pantanalinema sp. GBBB05]
MAYEFAQHVLDQLATATEIFAAGYVGINFVIYSWKRTESESSLTQPTIIPETTAVSETPLEVLQPLPLSLPKRELVEISATTNTEAPPIRQLVDLTEAPRSTEALPSINLAPPPADLSDQSVDELTEAEVEVEEPAPVQLAPAPEPTPIADVTASASVEPIAAPETTTASPAIAEPPTETESIATTPSSATAEPLTATKPVLKKPPVRPSNFGQPTAPKTTAQPAESADKLTEED